MQIHLNIAVVLSGAIIAQGIFAAVVLEFSKVNVRSNRMLALLLLTMSLWLIDSFFNWSGVYQQDPNYYLLPVYYSFAFGPLIYFYVKQLTNAGFRMQWRHAVHFIPVLLQGGLYCFLRFQDYSFRRWYWLEVHAPWTYRIEFNGTFVSLLIYLILAFRLLLRYQKWVYNNFSEVSRIRLNWLKVILAAMLLLGVQWLIEVVLREGFDSYSEYSYSPILLGILTLIVAFGGIRQSSLAKIHFEEPKPGPENLSEIDPRILKKIRERMEVHQDYLNPTLNLKEFAQSLQLPSRMVSEHINRGFDQSFIDFVNTYRVECVKQKLASNERDTYTLLAMALDSGFNSKSTFNRIFKQYTGKTPKEYRTTE